MVYIAEASPMLYALILPPLKPTNRIGPAAARVVTEEKRLSKEYATLLVAMFHFLMLPSNPVE
jgi:hypothetical protein